ncbi:MAG: hypothetical protein H7Z43_15510 [Clostridia bacterium]|nr:hypothetical protein [Deltaproteobacteria bacterium]
MKKLSLIFVSVLSVVACSDSGNDLEPEVACPEYATLSTQKNYCAEGTPSFAVTEACQIEVASPTRLALTTTDFSTGSLDIVTTATRSVARDVQSETTDSVSFYAKGLLYILGRFGFDRLDVLDGTTLALQHQISLKDQCATSVNPQSVAVRDDGVVFVPTYADTDIQIIDLTKAAGNNLVGRIPMQQYADADGIPELGLSITCGSTVFISAQRLDRNNAFAATGVEYLVPVDVSTCGTQETPISFLGNNAKQARADRADADGRTALILTSGIERVNFATQSVSWAVSADAFAAAGVSGFQLQSFDVVDATTAYVAAYAEDFQSVDILRVSLEGAFAPLRVITGLNAVEKTLEVIGTELWFGDSTFGSEGLRVYDLTQDPPVEIGPALATGLPPYSIIALP